MAGHDLIAIATTQWKNLPPEEARPQLAGVLADVVKLFTQTIGGYRRQLEGVSENATAQVLREQLDDWFADDARDASDWVVFYYTGHADIGASDSLYLLTHDFEPNRLVSTAFDLRQFADLVLTEREPGKPRKVSNLLVIIDACYAGAGVQDLASQFAKSFTLKSRGAFYLIGSALSRQEAQSGVFAAALIEAVNELSRRSVAQAWFSLDQIEEGINSFLEARGVQKPIFFHVSSRSKKLQFFANPNYVANSEGGVLASEARRAINDREFRDHWNPRARGVESDLQHGEYFVGRRRVLDELAAFFAYDGDTRTRVVTGRPGAGKSAILARVVVAAVSTSGKAGNVVVPAIDLAIHAQGKSLDDVTKRFADALTCAATPESVLTRLRASTTPFRVIVDALDEAAEPGAIAERLLMPLNDLEKIKLVVGTRERYVDALAGAAVIDIDQDEYASVQDIADYVEARLLRAHEPPYPTPYAGKQEQARRVAAAVARKAHPNFFVARLIVENLLSLRKAVNPDSPKDVAFPTQVGEAFDEWLALFGDDETRVRDLFLPLAYAEGQGLPWDNLWAPLASALSGRAYDDTDVHWLLEHAGAFVLESAERGRSVYRLYHQALADTLRRGRVEAEIDAVFVATLTASVPRQAASDLPDWLRANPYMKTHLAAHAVRGGALAFLLRQPSYLLAADAPRLLQAIAQTECERQLVAAYRACVHRLSRDPPDIAVSYLELAARQHGLDAFAEATNALDFRRRWRVPWTTRSRRIVPSSFALGDSEITVLTMGEWGANQPVAVIGRRDGSVQVFDLARDMPFATWRPEPDAGVSMLAFAMTDDGPVVVAALGSRTLGVLWPASGKSFVRQCDDGVVRLTALCIVQRRGEWVCVSAGWNYRLVVRRLSDLTELLSVKAEPAKIFYLGVVRWQNGLALVSTGDHLPTEVRESPDVESRVVYERARQASAAMVRLRSIDDLSVLWESDEKYGIGDYVASYRFDGRDMMLLSQRNYSVPHLWNLDTLELCFKAKQQSSRAWLCSTGDDLFLLEQFLQLSVSVLARTDANAMYTARPLGKLNCESGSVLGDLIRLRGRTTLLDAMQTRVRAWDVDDLLAEIRLPRDEGIVVDAVCLDGGATGELVVAVARRIASIDAVTGATTSSAEVGMSFEALAPFPGRPEVVVGLSEGVLHRIDRQTGRMHSPIRCGDEVKCVRTTLWRGRPIAFVTVSTGNIWQLRVWDLDTAAEIETNDSYRLFVGEEDKMLRALAIEANGDGVRIAFASSYGKVMTATFDGAIPDSVLGIPGFPRRYQEWNVATSYDDYVYALASTAATDDRAPLLAGGTENGMLVVWDFSTGARRGLCEQAHRGHIFGLAFGCVNACSVLASSGDDRVLRLWTESLEEIMAIELGDTAHTLIWLDEDILAVRLASGVVLPIRFEPGCLE